jgi:hypothetical protein
MHSFSWAFIVLSDLRGGQSNACVVLTWGLVPPARQDQVATQTLNNDVVFTEGLMHQSNRLNSSHNL